MRSTVLALVRHSPGATWMTLGDGNYGSDAHFLKENGARVLATSLTDGSLAYAKERGYIDDFEAVNAEKIPKPDDTFDYVFCKEAYHHFPRPAVAFYEMLRVAKKAVVLIEPQATSSKRPFGALKDALKKVIRNGKSSLFEETGNYIYRINITEVEKMMTSLNYNVVATKRMNDFFHPKLAVYKYESLSFHALATKIGIAVQDALCALRLLDHGLATVIAFKEPPSEALKNALKRDGFHLSFLPVNPYIK